MTRRVLLVLAVFACAGPLVRADDPPPEAPKLPEVVVREPAPPPAPAPRPAPAAPNVAGDAAPQVITGGALRGEQVPVEPLRGVGSRDVLTPEWIRDSAPHDVNEIVRYLPSASSRPYNGAEASAPNFSMRGMPDDGLTEYVHVLIDGVPASPLPYGWTAFSFFPITPERVWAVDWVRGGHTVRYSPDTVAGVINFITRPIPDRPWAQARGQVGSYGYTSAAGFAGGTWGRWGVLLSGVTRSGDGFRDQAEWSQDDFAVKVRYETAPGDWLYLGASTMDDQHKSPGGLTQAEFDADPLQNSRPRNRFEGDRTAIDLLYHDSLGSCGWWEAFAWFSRGYRNLQAQDEIGPPLRFFSWTDESFVFGAGVRGESNFRIGGVEHTLHAGARYESDRIPHWRIESEDFFVGGPITTDQDTEGWTYAWSFHVDDTFEPVCGLTANVGARLEWVPEAGARDPVVGFEFTEDFLRVLPGVGLSYAPGDTWAVYANYYEGFRSPQVWGFRWTDPTKGLDFELGRTAEVGLRVQGLRGISAELTGWRVEFDEFTTFDTGFYENFGHIVTYGADLTVEADLGCLSRALTGFSLWGSVTLQDPELQSGVDAGNVVPYAPKSKAAWRARYERCGWAASLGGTWYGETFSDPANTVDGSADGFIGLNPAVTLWDARVEKSLRLRRNVELEAAVGATNLFDTDWFLHSRGGFFGGGLVAGSPREVYASLALTVEF